MAISDLEESIRWTIKNRIFNELESINSIIGRETNKFFSISGLVYMSRASPRLTRLSCVTKIFR